MKSWSLFLFLLITQPVLAMDGCNSLPDSDQQMIHCKAIVGDYPRPVHFFIPTELEHTSDLKIFIHFHGHNLPGYDHFYHTKIKGEGYGDYGAFLLASKVNGVVVVPESLGNCATYDSYFADKDRTANFLNVVENKILISELNPTFTLALSAHSGAYRVLNRLAGYANINQTVLLNQLKGIGLFDATYGSVNNIEKWVKNESDKNEDFIFYDSYVSGVNATAEDGSLMLKKEFKDISADKIFFSSVLGKKSEALLDQHFSVLKLGGLVKFWQKINSLNSDSEKN